MKFSTIHSAVLVLWFLCVLVVTNGCGADSGGSFSEQSRMLSTDEKGAVASMSTNVNELTLTSQIDKTDDDTTTKIRRRIVYNTTLALIVEEYSAFETSFLESVDQHGGFVAKSETNRAFQDRQSGVWVARVPVEEYSSFVAEVVQLGFAETRIENADDITSEFVDIQARIRNNEELEKRIITMLEERTGKLSDVIEIERELSRVREEVERMQGRLRVMEDQSSLATITVRVREEREYVPAKAPTLRTRLASSWGGSLSTLRHTGEGFLVFFVGAVPWLVVGLLVAMVFGVPLRSWLRRRSQHQVSA